MPGELDYNGMMDYVQSGCDQMGIETDVCQTNHEGDLEQLQSHLLGQTALIHLQLGADYDYRTTGVVNTLTQQVLTETSLLTFQHVGQGFQSTVVRTGDR